MLHSSLHPGFSLIHGVGLVALRDIPMGTAIWWPCPRCHVIGAEEQAGTPKAVLRWIDEFGYRRADGGVITPCRGAFLMNHSCDPAVLDSGLAVGLAVRDIERGSEATCDYRTFRYERPWSFACGCRSRGCVGIVRSASGDPLPELLESWSRRLSRALASAALVAQETLVRSGDIHGGGHVP